MSLFSRALKAIDLVFTKKLYMKLPIAPASIMWPLSTGVSLVVRVFYFVRQ